MFVLLIPFSIICQVDNSELVNLRIEQKKNEKEQKKKKKEIKIGLTVGAKINTISTYKTISSPPLATSDFAKYKVILYPSNIYFACSFKVNNKISLLINTGLDYSRISYSKGFITNHNLIFQDSLYNYNKYGENLTFSAPVFFIYKLNEKFSVKLGAALNFSIKYKILNGLNEYNIHYDSRFSGMNSIDFELKKPFIYYSNTFQFIPALSYSTNKNNLIDLRFSRSKIIYSHRLLDGSFLNFSDILIKNWNLNISYNYFF